MTKITFGLIRERKTPPDRRVVFSPEKCRTFKQQFPLADICVESSEIRIFPDGAYRAQGVTVCDDLSHCDVLLGVKEVPVEALLPEKKYFFFSHTIKKQPYNRGLLQAVLEKNITLYDHETVTDPNGKRLIGFGRYAGLVGAYNGFRALGLRDGLFELPKTESLSGLGAIKAVLDKTTLPSIKIALSGSGKVARGAREILEHLNIEELSPATFLENRHTGSVFCAIDILDYNRRKDGKVLNRQDFYDNPQEYESNFMNFARVANMFIAGHFFRNGSPYLFTREDARHPDFNIDLVADISCDIDGPVASTIRPSTIAGPFYGYDPKSEAETAFDAPGAITVMAVDNLPCELPKDASEGFGDMFLEHVIPAFFNGDKESILHRACVAQNGRLTERFGYLQDYVDGMSTE